MRARARPSASVRARNSGLSANSARIDFHHHRGLGVDVSREVDHPHAPFAEHPLDRVFAVDERALPEVARPRESFVFVFAAVSWSSAVTPTRGNPHRMQKAASLVLASEQEGQRFNGIARPASRPLDAAGELAAGGLRPVPSAQSGPVDGLDLVPQRFAKCCLIVVIHHGFAETLRHFHPRGQDAQEIGRSSTRTGALPIGRRRSSR